MKPKPTGAVLRSVFAFLALSRSTEERAAAYIVREHHRGRRLDDILEDHYIRARLSEEQVSRVLRQAPVIRALTNDTVEARREVVRLLSHNPT